jgi:hypothetical protein
MTTILPSTRSLAYVSAALVAIALGTVACAQVIDLNAGELDPLAASAALDGSAGNSEGGGSICANGKATCGAEACSVDLATDVNHCGACGQRCAASNGAVRCNAGACELTTCNAGFDNCDGTPVNGCEAELAKNSVHCARCGHSCGGGQCVEGVCQLVPFADTDGEVRDLKISGNTLYVLADWTMLAYDLGTGKVVQSFAPPELFAGTLATTATKAFVSRSFTADGGAEALGIQAPPSTPTCLLPNIPIVSMTADAASLYVARFGPGLKSGEVLRVDPTSSCASPKSTSLGKGLFRVVSMTTDADSVFWATVGPEGSIVRLKGGGDPDTLVDKAANIAAIAQDGDNLYWTWDKGLYRLPKLNACGNLNAGCDTAAKFATDVRGAFFVDTDLVYGAKGNPTDGYQVVVRAKSNGENKGSIRSPAPVTAIVADAKSIYFAAGRRVLRVAK